MRIRQEGDRFLLCGIILPLGEIHAGQVWQSSSGDSVRVTSVDQDSDIVYYMQSNGVDHHKDGFSFQCRYSLVLEVE